MEWLFHIQMKHSVHIHWFRNDLRLYDHPLVEQLNREVHFLPLYILPDKKNTPWGFKKSSALRKKWLMQHLDDLNAQLEKQGQELIVLEGNHREIFRKLESEFDVLKVTYQKEYATEELEEEEAMKDVVGENKAIALQDGFLIHPEDLPFSVDKTPDVFTQFRKKVEKYASVKEPFDNITELPEAPDTSVLKDDRIDIEGDDSLMEGAIPFTGGATNGLERLQYYLFDSEKAATYKKTRNGLIGADYSTKFSVWMNVGALSPRYIYQQIKIFEKEVTKNQSTYWIIFELLWRDYFRYVAKKFGDRIFYKEGLKQEPVEWSFDSSIFDKWKNGETQDEFVNANMIELKQTGFMSNRGRQNVASYLVHDLKQDWRAGAAWFEHCLLDYDVYSNQGNWLYNAGIGNDPRPNRKFNTQLQAERYDPEKKYRAAWIKEKL